MGHLFSRAIKRLTFGSVGGNSSSSSTASGSRNQLPDNEGHASSSQREQDFDGPAVQTIPVGQSIDSAEYAAFRDASNSPPKQQTQIDDTSEQSPPIKEEEDSMVNVDKENVANYENDEPDENSKLASNFEQDDKSKPQVEEAVIKIQALVRGHLTRKALKDAQQQAATVPPNALGQSHFDEESLTKNPPNALFLPSSPLTETNQASNELLNGNNQQQQLQTNKHVANSRVPPLESIAEDVETAGATESASDKMRFTDMEETQAEVKSAEGGADATSDKQTSASSSEERPPSPQAPEMPAISSEATASIDIHCDTPASASIDILDYNSKPSFGIASVLHHNVTQPIVGEDNDKVEDLLTTFTDDEQSSRGYNETQDQTDEIEVDIEKQASTVLPDITESIISQSASFDTPNHHQHHHHQDQLAQHHQSRHHRNTLATSTASSLPASPPHINLASTTNSHSIDSAEAAAIRIQSAFRGYHTRKHSPYRRRSPFAANASANSPPRHAAGPLSNGLSTAGSLPTGATPTTSLSINDHGPRRTTLRQQDAREDDEEDLMDDDDNDVSRAVADREGAGDDDEDEGVES